MISPETAKLLSELRRTNYGKALSELLDEKYAELNNVKHCSSWEDTLGRAKALQILDEIFHFMKEKETSLNKARYD